MRGGVVMKTEILFELTKWLERMQEAAAWNPTNREREQYLRDMEIFYYGQLAGQICFYNGMEV